MSAIIAPYQGYGRVSHRTTIRSWAEIRAIQDSQDVEQPKGWTPDQILLTKVGRSWVAVYTRGGYTVAAISRNRHSAYIDCLDQVRS